MNKNYDLKKLKEQYAGLENLIQLNSMRQKEIEALALKIRKTIVGLTINKYSNGKSIHKHDEYTHRDIINLIKKGYGNKYIQSKLGALDSEIGTIRYHYKLGTYTSKKMLNRTLTENEKSRIYRDFRKGKDTDYVSENYKVKKIRARGFLSAYKRQLGNK